MALRGKVCIVTGATRGIGKGIALQLGEAGATVYITGRTLKSSGPIGGSLEETAEEVESRGGKCIAVQCDHSKDADIEALFERVKREQNGQLDVLVNNAYSAVNVILKNMGKSFWEQPPTVWDDVNNVGLRNHYYCTVLASRMMTERKQGLIVNVSSPGGLKYLFNVPYGVGKEALDRMAADCAFELRRHKVAMVSLWPGPVNTETVTQASKQGDLDGKPSASIFDQGESPEYSGKCVVNLAADPNIMTKTGKIVLSFDLGNEYGFVDVDGSKPMNIRSIQSLLMMGGYKRLGPYVPAWISFPRWMVSLRGNKF